MLIHDDRKRPQPQLVLVQEEAQQLAAFHDSGLLDITIGAFLSVAFF